MKARSVKILPVTELLIAPKHECKSLISSATFPELPTNFQCFLKVKEEKETEVCTAVHKPLSKSVWQTAVISMTATVYYSDTSVRKQATLQNHPSFLTPGLLPALTSTQTDSICCVQKRQPRKKTGFQGPNSCWIFSPRLASGQLQGKYLRKRVDKASKNKLLTWPSHHLRVSENVAKLNQGSNSTSLIHYCRLISNVFKKKKKSAKVLVDLNILLKSNLFHYVMKNI